MPFIYRLHTDVLEIMNYKHIFVWIAGVVLYLFSDPLMSNERDIQGYMDIVSFKNRVIAVGTDGRIDTISKSGDCVNVDRYTRSKLNTVFLNNDLLIIAGDQGIILYSSDGESFQHSEFAIDANINSLAACQDFILAGADQGWVLASMDGKTWDSISTGSKGNILSLSSNSSIVVGITNCGEIIQSADGISWDILNYNETYAKYYPPVYFKKVLAAGNSMVIIGTHVDGSPAILFSSLGTVWTERLPVYYGENGIMRSLQSEPNDILYDSDQSQFILACDNGVLFSLPNCSKCNKWLKISESDLTAICLTENFLFIAGDAYAFFIQRM